MARLDSEESKNSRLHAEALRLTVEVKMLKHDIANIKTMVEYMFEEIEALKILLGEKDDS